MIYNFRDMKKLRSTHLRSLILLILPGVLMLLQRSGILGNAGTTTFFVLLLIISILYLIDIKKTGQIEVRHFPALGVLFWETWFLTMWFLGAHGAGSLIESLLGVLTLMSLIVIFRFRKNIPKSAWGIMLLLIFVLLLVAIATTTRWLNIFLMWLIIWLIRVLPFFAMGLLLFQRLGIKAALLMIVCIPVWLEMYLAPDGISYAIWASSDPQIHLALVAFRLLPSLCFLLLIPVVSSVLTDVQKLRIWLVGTSFIFISSLVIIWTTFLLDPSISYIFSAGQMFVYFMSVLWTPIVTAVIVFGKQALYPTTRAHSQMQD